MLTALVDYEELSIFGNDVSMFARNSRIGNHQIPIHFAANRIRSVIQRERLLLISLDVDHHRENTRDPTRRCNRGNRHALSHFSVARHMSLGTDRKAFYAVLGSAVAVLDPR